MPDRKNDLPEGWMPGAKSVSRGDQQQMVRAGNGFGSTSPEPPPREGQGVFGPQFHVGFPKLDTKPNRRVFVDPPISALSDWTMDDIRAALQAHALGNFQQSGQLVDSMTSDDRIASVLNTRIVGLLGLPFTITPRKKRKKDEDAKKAAGILRRSWDRIISESQIAEFLRWGITMGFAIGEIIWKARGGLWMPTVRTWHPQLCFYNTMARKFIVITMEGPIEVTPGDGKWIVYAPHGEYRGWMSGCVRTVSTPWIRRQYGLRDWGRHSEKHGKPWVVVDVPARADEGDKDRFFDSFNDMGDETAIQAPVLNDKERFDARLVEAQHPAADVFEKLISRCDTLISCAILGQNLTTEVQAGSYAAATVHGQVRQDYLESDAETLSTCLRQQLLRPFCKFNFARGTKIVPELAWDTTPPSDKKLNAEALQTLGGAVSFFQAAGVPIDMVALAAQYGLPLLPDAKAELPPPQAPHFPQHVSDPAKDRPGADPSDPPAKSPEEADGAKAGDGEPAAEGGSAPEVEQHAEEIAAADQLAARILAIRQGKGGGRTSAREFMADLNDAGRRAVTVGLAPDVKRVLAAVNGAKSFPALRRALLAAYRTMDRAKVARVVTNSMLLANLAGRAAVKDDL